jgi:hypothetical protein
LLSRVFCGAGLMICFLIVFLITAMPATHPPNGADKLWLFWGIPLFVIGGQLLQGALATYRNSMKRYRFEIKIDELGILRRAPDLEDLFFSRNDIVGFIEQKNGALFIRTEVRQRFIFVPPDIDDIQGLRQELLALNI